MEIQRSEHVKKLNYAPCKKEIIGIANLIAGIVGCTFDDITFEYNDHCHSIKGYGSEFMKNFSDEIKFYYIYMLAPWPSSKGCIIVKIYPNDECGLYISASHLTVAEVDDLINELSKKINAILSPKLQQSDNDTCDQTNAVNTHTKKWYKSEVFWGAVVAIVAIGSLILGILDFLYK